MEQFAKLPENERRDILQESANRRDGIREIIIEKDFWVCWVMGRLYALPELAPHITFKGGTSLSKAFAIIDRFSEDIDLTIGRTAPHICETKAPMEEGISGKEVKRRITALKDAEQLLVAEFILPALTNEFRDSLGSDEGWELVLDLEDADRQTLLFHYPGVFHYGMGYEYDSDSGYINPSVKLEFGARGETEPHETKAICPYVAEDFPQLFTHSTVDVPTLAAERSFWEKATILHALHHGSRIRDRMSRHYYDTFMIMQKGFAETALQSPELLEQVVRNKSLLFRDGKASYETAKLATLKLLPTDEMIPALRKDYAAMEEMFMAEAPAFETIMQELRTLEERINRQ